MKLTHRPFLLQSKNTKPMIPNIIFLIYTKFKKSFSNKWTAP